VYSIKEKSLDEIVAHIEIFFCHESTPYRIRFSLSGSARVGSTSECWAFPNPLFHPYHMIFSPHLRGDRINIFQLPKIKMQVQKQIPLRFIGPFSWMLVDSLWNYSHVTPFVVRLTSNISYLRTRTQSKAAFDSSC
jgi:hypothetical protein